jgi:hypothetical protein
MCWSEGDKARLLLCDGCEDEYHCYCVQPVLLEVPEGDWYCRLCQGGTGGTAGTGSTDVQAVPPQGVAQGSSGTVVDGWDMVAAAQLPEMCTAADGGTGGTQGMQYVRELVGVAQRLGDCGYGAWPAAARLQLLLLLCELLAGSNAGRRFIEERMDAKREAKKKVGCGVGFWGGEGGLRAACCMLLLGAKDALRAVDKAHCQHQQSYKNQNAVTDTLVKICAVTIPLPPPPS